MTLKILHIVSYVSPDGSYGGPLRVALNQARILRAAGHDVTLIAAAGGFSEKLPPEFDGIPVQLFKKLQVVPGSGFPGLTSPAMLFWIWRQAKHFDVVHVHMARDLLTLPAAFLCSRTGVPLIIQTHGMVKPSSKLISKPLDAIATCPTLSKASVVLYLTSQEKANLLRLGTRRQSLTELRNAVAVPDEQAVEQVNGPADKPEVIFLARMHARKRPHMVVKAAEGLREYYPNARFTLIGPDEGEGPRINAMVEQLGLKDTTSWSGPLPPPKTSERMRKASIFVLPSLNEPFGMSVVEAMAIGLPVIVTESCGLAEMINEQQAGIVCDSSEQGFVEAVEFLLRNPAKRAEIGRNARMVARQYYALDSLGKELLDIYVQERNRQIGAI
ncbi:glycosyltransferase [Kocuria sp. M4R2S49]|uniref:glycosyltransferase n=1 Tax=Kocuria rhizosphaericola TaxID=3376284 RepID=UPI0037B36289